MSFYVRAEGIMLQYLNFLNDKDVIKDSIIEKSLARNLFLNEFKPKCNITRFSFSSMLRVMTKFKLIRYKRNRPDVVHFKTDVSNFAIRYYKNDDTNNKPTATVNHTRQSFKTLKCNICNLIFFNQSSMDDHETSETHIERVKFATENEVQDVNGVIIEVENGFGNKPETIIVRQHEGYEVLINIVNTNPEACILEYVKEIHKSDFVAIEGPLLPCRINANSHHTLKLNVLFNDWIFYTYPMLLKLRNSVTLEFFDVVKKIMFHVHSDLVDDLHATKPYVGFSKPNVRDIDYEIVPGEPPSWETSKYKPNFKLAQYPLPQFVKVLLEHNFTEFPGISPQEKNMLKTILHDFASYSRIGTLDVNNYFNISQLRLYMEEYQMKIDIHLYDVDNQMLTAHSSSKKFLELFVPGLAEHRPSLLRGDSIYIQENKESKIKYEGRVHKVNQSSVILGFSQRFLDNVHVENKKYSVSFGFNRVPLRAEHQAITLARKHEIIPFLCPALTIAREVDHFDFNWYDIASNQNQKSAVEHILSQTARPLPYLIFGPPGTGKTVTVVEAILQIRLHKPDQKMLVCAPSNFAADEIMKRLIKKGMSKLTLFRYVALSYSSDLIDISVKPYTNIKDEFYHPSQDELLKYFVVVTTVVTASRLVNGGTPPGHFSYVFIDESGQATESEALIPIAGILSSAEKPGMIDGQIILAGDPQQLGPIIHSQRSNSFGYGMSMLERLMTKCQLYSKTENGYPDHFVTKLLKSYRSHPAILELPNRLFYDGELIPPEDTSLTHVAIGWEELPNKNFPLIYHSVIGKDEREANSPSFFNLQEIDVVAKYLETLIGSRLKGMKIEESHIGVITPYRKQVHKLQDMCKKRKWTKLMTGTVEQFQGQERLIIIISTVRSRPEFTIHDEKFHLGFLKNPKRFNVAITRAKALLIVVGNPNILQHDDCWRNFIQYCVDNNATRGTQFQMQSLVPNATVEANSEETEDSANFSRGNI